MYLYNNISPGKDHWQSAGSGLSGCPYNLIFLQKELRVELSISRSQTEENKFLFDYLYGQKAEIEQRFGQPLHWMRLDDKKMSRIQFCVEADGYNKEVWPQSIQWHIEHMTRFEQAMKPSLQQASDALKITGRSLPDEINQIKPDLQE